MRFNGDLMGFNEIYIMRFNVDLMGILWYLMEYFSG
jgi:hypothetical protein